jgi:hypothetical protein
MTFSFSFFACDGHAAEHKLQSVHAPGAVKALVEKALCGVPKFAPPAQSTSVTTISDKATSGGDCGSKPMIFIGVMVEVCGHIDEAGNASEIQRFLVKPVYGWIPEVRAGHA